jgi:hypothetical protein
MGNGISTVIAVGKGKGETLEEGSNVSNVKIRNLTLMISF